MANDSPSRCRNVLRQLSSESRLLGREIKSSVRGFVSRSRKYSMGEPNSDTALPDYYIPDYILVPGSDVTEVSYELTCPVLVFINSKSGGQLGGELLVSYRSLLNKNQVVDLTEKKPDRVLRDLYVNLEALKYAGDELAAQVQKQLRIIVAGGDGTACWLLGVISDLKLPCPPSIATVPLGTGNNLPFSFGWGKKNPSTDCQAAGSFLERVKMAKEMKVDSWHIIMRMRAPKEGACEPIAPLELPHALHAFHRVSDQDTMNVEGCHTYRGGFWNYFSMGMDAQVSYAFHAERKLHPEKFQKQIVNQSTYMKLAGTYGLTSLLQPASKNLSQLAKVKIMNKHGSWEDLNIPRSIKSIICLNLPSFSGGLNPWGQPRRRKYVDKGFTPVYVDDGLIEVIGFRDTWHGFVLLAPNGHGTRLAQTSRLRFEFHKGAADHTYMRIDGEPWKQPLPCDDDTVVVEISHFGQVGMLAAPSCRSKSVYDPSSPSFGHEEEDSSSVGDLIDEEEEERRKFGAADTFKIPDEIDIAHFS